MRLAILGHTLKEGSSGTVGVVVAAVPAPNPKPAAEELAADPNVGAELLVPPNGGRPAPLCMHSITQCPHVWPP